MKDFEVFQDALRHGQGANGGDGDRDGSYMNSLTGSMCLVLEEFYNNLRVGFSVSGLISSHSIPFLLWSFRREGGEVIASPRS